MKKAVLSSLCALIALCASAAEPAGYYSSCVGLSGAKLLAELEKVVGSHTSLSYNNLWTLFGTTDIDDNGKIWDMYSTKRFTYITDQCGSATVLGSCYNREHSMPKSWFNSAAPMYTDGFHLYPTDGYINSARGNNPFGECENGKTYSNGSIKGLGKVGNSTYPGYSGTVFEPDDQYKGDFARTYFYMVAAYNSKVSGWDSSGTNLGGTAYPGFNNWSREMFVKWHNLDPVSAKEINRNEAVYAQQHNRNPFIDHPELVDYIWGDKSNQGWPGQASADPVFKTPVNNTTVAIGATMVGVKRTATVVVSGANLTGTVAVSVAGAGFSVSTSSFSASAANTTSGYTLTVSFNPTSAGTFTGTLTLKCGTATANVNLTASATSTIPAGPVRSISDDSFEAVWSYVGEATNGKYTLNVMQNGVSISGYPTAVDAAVERYDVENLEPSTTYTYTVSSASHTSNVVSVTTADPQPIVNVFYDGELILEAEVGEASAAAEIELDIFNISSDIRLSVNAPFQLSENKGDWTTAVTINPDQDRIYVRMLSSTSGTFEGTLTIESDNYFNDTFDFTGIASSGSLFFEDFEATGSSLDNYNNKSYQGTAARWNITDGGIYSQDFKDKKVYAGQQSIRFGKTSTSALEMAEDLTTGVGTVSMWVGKWSATESTTTFVVEYSTDGGATWTNAGSSEVTEVAYSQRTFTINALGNVRLRVRQTSGASRWFLDNLEASPYKASVADVTAPEKQWDAFCRGGQLVIETTENITAFVYALDGTEVFVGQIAPGQKAIYLPKGLYIVAVENFGRRVLVK